MKTNSGSEVVLINEVGPRDGLQNQAKHLSPAQRITLINSLVAAGMPSIEIGSFVSPKAVPAMANTDQVFAGLEQGSASYSVLVPNKKGYDLAKEFGVKAVNLVVAASNTMNEKNIGMNTAAAMAVSADVIGAAAAAGIRAEVYIATAWECPFEGAVDPGLVLGLMEELIGYGTDAIILADTIGAAAPSAVRRLAAQAQQTHGSEKLCCHFHDTRGFGVANVYAALEAGIRRFDASIGGLGGCPFAPGASGNVATENVALLLQQEGFDTGINLKALMEAVAVAGELTGACVGGAAYRWMQQQAVKGRL